MKFTLPIKMNLDVETGIHLEPLGDRFPKLRTNATVYLQFDDDQLADQDEAEYWASTRDIVVPNEVGLWAGFKQLYFEDEETAKQNVEFEKHHFRPDTTFFNFWILLLTDEPVVMVKAKGGPSALKPVPIRIPIMNQQAKSLNHACTIISEAFQPQRLSHTTNVFQSVYYFNGVGWHSLEHLRQM